MWVIVRARHRRRPTVLREWLSPWPIRDAGAKGARRASGARNLQNMKSEATHRAGSLLARLLATLVVVQAGRLIHIYRSVDANKQYWLRRASLPSQPGDFVYVALGDSVANGIGASRPQNGYVGLVARRIHDRTGRGVRVINVSVTGATTADVVREQLPKIQGVRPDLVTLDIGANDVNRRVRDDVLLRDFTTILDALPERTTIVADLPTFKRGPKQSTLLRLNAEIRDRVEARGMRLAPIFDVTSSTIGDWRTYGADLFHPSNRGHRNWYRAFVTQVDAVLSSEVATLQDYSE